jgi:hypothetical protein
MINPNDENLAISTQKRNIPLNIQPTWLLIIPTGNTLTSAISEDNRAIVNEFITY